MKKDTVDTLPEYVKHKGTLLVAGNSRPQAVAWCAWKLLQESVRPVELVFIGAAAGHIALKAVGILTEIADRNLPDTHIIVYRPTRYSTIVAGSDKKVDMQAWEVYVINTENLKK